jgi:hypothetical protein
VTCALGRTVQICKRDPGGARAERHGWSKRAGNGPPHRLPLAPRVGRRRAVARALFFPCSSSRLRLSRRAAEWHLLRRCRGVRTHPPITTLSGSGSRRTASATQAGRGGDPQIDCWALSVALRPARARGEDATTEQRAGAERLPGGRRAAPRVRALGDAGVGQLMKCVRRMRRVLTADSTLLRLRLRICDAWAHAGAGWAAGGRCQSLTTQHVHCATGWGPSGSRRISPCLPARARRGRRRSSARGGSNGLSVRRVSECLGFL